MAGFGDGRLSHLSDLAPPTVPRGTLGKPKSPSGPISRFGDGRLSPFEPFAIGASLLLESVRPYLTVARLCMQSPLAAQFFPLAAGHERTVLGSRRRPLKQVYKRALRFGEVRIGKNWEKLPVSRGPARLMKTSCAISSFDLRVGEPSSVSCRVAQPTPGGSRRSARR
jgi:hypothetical protein